MRWLPILASFVVHGGALVGLALTCARPATGPECAPMFLLMQDADTAPSPEVPEPLVPPEPMEIVERTIEPEPLPEEPAPEEPQPVDFEVGAVEEPTPICIPVPRAPVRIAPLRHAKTEPDPPPPPPRAKPSAVAVRVTAAVPRGDSCRPPRYPSSAQRLGHEGHVVLLVHVGADGIPISVEVEESSGYSTLDEAALEAVRDWVFEPAHEGDHAIESVVHVPFRFRLRA